MNPGSISYFLLLVFTVGLFYLLKGSKSKQWVLFLASLVFLSFFGVVSLSVCLLLSVLNFFYAQKVTSTEYTFTKLAIINTINIGVLLGFRFVGEFDEKFSLFPHDFMLGSGVLVALGIGFYTLQNIAYQIDIYKKRYKPEENLLLFTLGNTFFARMSSGPIVNINSFNKQLSNLPNGFTEANFTVGLQRVLIGLIKKLVIAERFSYYVNLYFDSSTTHQFGAGSGYDVLVGSILFTLQLYFDFSGYMDIAIGSARFFGIGLNENFNMPLRAQSISDWWRRWHITLINWFTQYIYYPVAYRFRNKRTRATVLAIISTFLVSSLWHGFGLTYLIWGLLHIIYLITETLLKKNLLDLNKKLTPTYYAIIFTPLTILMASFANMFFRSDNIHVAMASLSKLFDLTDFWPKISFKDWLLHGEDWKLDHLLSVRLGFIFAILFIVFEHKIIEASNKPKFNVMWFVFLIVILAVFGVFDSANRFIYMDF